MGSMAGRAFAFFDQGMLKAHLFSIHESPRIPMATKTYFGLFAFHQRGSFRRVGSVTIHTKGTWTYVTVDLFKIVFRGFVALETQGCAIHLKPQRVARLKTLMAGSALFLGKRLMKDVFDQAFSVRPVGTVARRTIRTLNRIPQVGFPGFLIGDGMTGGTKSFSIFVNESVVIRCVGAVATKALAFLQRGMDVFPCKTAFSVMALEAKFLVFCLEKAFVLRSMGNVTGKAFACTKRLVAVLSGPNLFILFMATSAKDADLFLDQAFMLGSMGIVTA